MNERYAACKTLLDEHKIKIEELAELLLKKETLSLPDIVDTLGERPFGVKESIAEYLTELRARQETVDEVRDEEEKKAEDLRKEAADGTKFDPDAEEPEEGDEEKKSSEDAAAKAETSSEDATETKPEDKVSEAKEDSEDAASKAEEETKKDDKDKKE